MGWAGSWRRGIAVSPAEIVGHHKAIASDNVTIMGSVLQKGIARSGEPRRVHQSLTMAKWIELV